VDAEKAEAAASAYFTLAREGQAEEMWGLTSEYFRRTQLRESFDL
jgi:hypothetical protein